MSDSETAGLIDRTIAAIGDYLAIRNVYKGWRLHQGMDEAGQLKFIKDVSRDKAKGGNEAHRLIQMLTPELEACGEDSSALLTFDHCIAGGGGPDNAYPLWPAVKVSLQRLATRLRPPHRDAEPLSKLDLPNITEAAKTLYRTIETPPAADWQAPAWVVAMNFRGTTKKELAKKPPEHYWLIRAAVHHVAKALKLKTLCPDQWTDEIGASPFDARQRLALVKLCKLMANIFDRSWMKVDSGECQLDLEILRGILEGLDAAPQSAPIAPPAGGNDDEGNSLPTETNRRKKKKPGPKKARYNIANDKKIFDQWIRGRDQGDFPDYAECDKTHKHPRGTTKAAVARHRGRERNAQ
jgi:hypothetical protein